MMKLLGRQRLIIRKFRKMEFIHDEGKFSVSESSILRPNWTQLSETAFIAQLVDHTNRFAESLVQLRCALESIH